VCCTPLMRAAIETQVENNTLTQSLIEESQLITNGGEGGGVCGVKGDVAGIGVLSSWRWG